MFKNINLGTRIFLPVTLLVLAGNIVFLYTTSYFIGKQRQRLDRELFERDFKAVDIQLNKLFDTTGILDKNTFRHTELNQAVDIIAEATHTGIDLYNPWGVHLYKAARADITTYAPALPAKVLGRLDSLRSGFVKREILPDSLVLNTAYYKLTNQEREEIGVVRISYPETNYFSAESLSEFLISLRLVSAILIVVSILVALAIARQISRPLKKISRKISDTDTPSGNTKLEWKGIPEIGALIEAYNGMTDRLEESANRMVSTEREKAWEQMAKMVAHEIKNPLTPMKLTLQMLQMNFRPGDPDAQQKIDHTADILIQQIDALDKIATAFSDFSGHKESDPSTECTDLSKTLPLILGLFHKDYILYEGLAEPIMAPLSKTSLVQVFNNVIKNAIQALESAPEPSIRISLSIEDRRAVIQISNNGKTIPREDIPKIFEPSFTTKTSGKGLGLAVVKKIIASAGGDIYCESNDENGTIFIITLPISRCVSH